MILVTEEGQSKALELQQKRPDHLCILSEIEELESAIDSLNAETCLTDTD